MPLALETNWQPMRLMEVAASADTSTGATELTTDAGPVLAEPALAGLAVFATSFSWWLAASQPLSLSRL
jgi:hypothetical protein